MYPRSQLLAVRLEDFNAEPRAHLASIFAFLGVKGDALSDPEWQAILVDRTFNEHRYRAVHSCSSCSQAQAALAALLPAIIRKKNARKMAHQLLFELFTITP